MSHVSWVCVSLPGYCLQKKKKWWKKKQQTISHPVCCLEGHSTHSSWSDAISYWPCHSQHGNQMRATQTWDWEELWIEGTLKYSLFPSISLATLAGNLVRKLFCVCLWTMQSQVRLIQKETQHKRRSYACSDDCCYRIAVVQYFPFSQFPLQKTQIKHTNKSVSQHRSSDLLRIVLK